MSNSIHSLLALFDDSVARGQPLVLGTVVHTSGPTYTKAGAHLLIAADGVSAGLVSGGCLESDLAEHGRAVFSDGAARLVRYDMRGPDDLLFGLGSGCEGAMDILLQRLDMRGGWQPLARLVEAWRAERSERLLLVVESADAALPAGTGVFLGDGNLPGTSAGEMCDPPFPAAAETADSAQPALPGLPLQRYAESMNWPAANRLLRGALPGVDLLAMRQPAPEHILLLGAGPDSRPVASFAAALGWRVTIIDHRSHYAQPRYFPGAATVLDGGPAALAALLASPGAAAYSAAVVMSHSYGQDRAYLQLLARAAIGYVGLLGPASRSERLLQGLGEAASGLRDRLHAPVGLQLGAATPESIALSIVAEIQAAVAGRPGRPTAGAVRP